MIIVFDIGNTSVHTGIFNQSKLIYEDRVFTDKKNLDQIEKFIKKISKEYFITTVVISSVVPSIDNAFNEICKKYFRMTPYFVSSKSKTNIKNFDEKYKHMGTDRICDVVCAISKYKSDVIIVNMGTATKFEIISDQKYLGGIIAPGLLTSYYSLIKNADKLEDKNLINPKKIIGDNSTIEQLSIGFIIGFAKMIDGLIEEILSTNKLNNPKIILCGGQSDFIKDHLEQKYIHNKLLTLEGLYLLWKLNKN